MEILSHCLFGLSAHDLIGDDWAWGGPDRIHDLEGARVGEPGGLFPPTALGVEFYLWAHGKGAKSLEAFLDPDEVFEYPDEIVIPEGAQLVSDLRAVDVESIAAQSSEEDPQGSH